MQAYTAQVAIGHSTLRNQGAPGVISTARAYLSEIDLGQFAALLGEHEFKELLNKETKSLAERFPGAAKGNWGAARKAINIFLRDCLYNLYLSKMYSLQKLESWLELPLDRNVGTSLRKLLPKMVPNWGTIKCLTPEVSEQFQAAAALYAKRQNVCKVHLDIEFWRKDEKSK